MSMEAKLDAKPAADLSWMAGRWVGDVWGGRMEEWWSEPSGGTMLGMNRVVVDGKTHHREFLALEFADGGTTMTVFLVRDTGQPLPPVSFRQTAQEERSATFSNEDHERLSRIDYRREGERLLITLHGKRKEKPFKDEIELTLAAC